MRDAKGGSRGAGISFERQQQKALRERFGEAVQCNPWFEFFDDGELHYCSPDAVLWLDPSPIVLEFKLTHTADAYRQLFLLYLPVLRAYRPGAPFRAVEICRTFLPSVEWPGDVTLIGDVERAPRRGTGIYVVNKFL